MFILYISLCIFLTLIGFIFGSVCTRWAIEEEKGKRKR